MQKSSSTLPPEPHSYLIDDPEAFARNLLKMWEESQRIVTGAIDRSDGKLDPYSSASEMSAASKTLSDIAQIWMTDPAKLAEAQGDLLRSYAELWNHQVNRWMGGQSQPVATPEPGDNRFKDREWSENPYFDFWKQAYLVTTRWADDVLEKTDGLDERTRQKAEFYFRQISSAFSPSNVPFLNPEVMRELFATNGQSLVAGLEQLALDLEKSGDLLKISQTDTQAFEVGRNLAVTPGKIVFQNDVLQLIQYAPTTEQVFEVPLLVVPPWINKYYILDLTPSKSLIRFALDQGFTVFVVSWVNPDQSLAHKTFEDYMFEGVLAATDAVKRETGRDTINVLGYCVGGTLLATALAYLAKRGEAPYISATFLTTQVDFSKAGDLLLFTDDAQLASLEQMMTERGYLDGSRMANVFNLLRPRDLVWPYIVNNYLLGKKPFPFDLLFWNQDSTRMAAANHGFYLREFYRDNRLALGGMRMGGFDLDLTDIRLPIYELATREDHIAPAASVFLGSRMFSGPVEFVLAGSGHIAGVVNPPDKMKYQYWTANKAAADTLEEWIGMARETPGSWWPHWAKWLEARSGESRDARKPGSVLGTIEDAPGSYVTAKS